MAILKALVPIFLHMIFCALICLGDFGLWLILAVAKKHGAVEYNVEGTAKSTYEIKVRTFYKLQKLTETSQSKFIHDAEIHTITLQSQ